MELAPKLDNRRRKVAAMTTAIGVAFGAGALIDHQILKQTPRTRIEIVEPPGPYNDSSTFGLGHESVGNRSRDIPWVNVENSTPKGNEDLHNGKTITVYNR